MPSLLGGNTFNRENLVTLLGKDWRTVKINHAIGSKLCDKKLLPSQLNSISQLVQK